MGLEDYLPKIKATLESVYDIVKGYLVSRYGMRILPTKYPSIFASLVEYDPSRLEIQVSVWEESVDFLIYDGEYYELTRGPKGWSEPRVYYVGEEAAIPCTWPISMMREEIVRKGSLEVIFKRSAQFEITGFPEEEVLMYFFSTPGLIGCGTLDISEMKEEGGAIDFWISCKVLFGFPRVLSFRDSLKLLIIQESEFHSIVKSLRGVR